MTGPSEFVPRFKAQVGLEEIGGTKSVAEPCREYNPKASVVSEWRATMMSNAASAFDDPAAIYRLERFFLNRWQVCRCTAGCLQWMPVDAIRMACARNSVPPGTLPWIKISGRCGATTASCA